MASRKTKTKSNHGGPRPGSGRKPKPATVIREALISEIVKMGGPEYGLDLYDRTMRDDRESIAVRLECAREIMNRAWGKPGQSIAVTGADEGPLRIQYVNDWRTPGTPATADGG